MTDAWVATSSGGGAWALGRPRRDTSIHYPILNYPSICHWPEMSSLRNASPPVRDNDSYAVTDGSLLKGLECVWAENTVPGALGTREDPSGASAAPGGAAHFSRPPSLHRKCLGLVFAGPGWGASSPTPVPWQTDSETKCPSHGTGKKQSFSLSLSSSSSSSSKLCKGRYSV